MSSTPPPPRKPRFLSAVPTEQHIETARFGVKPGPAQVRPVATEAHPPAPGKAGSADEANASARAQGTAPQAPALPQHPGAQAIQLPPAVAVTPASNAAAPHASAQNGIPVELVRSRLAAAIEALQLQSEKLAEQARADVLEVAFQIARRIVEVEVRQSPEPLFALIRTSLAQLATARRITLRVSPQDIDALRSARGQEVTGALSLAEIELTADASLEAGECLIDSDLGHIDGRLANRFAELRRHVAEASEGAA